MIINLSEYWTHNLSPFIWQFPEPYDSWGPGGIRWYGIAYLLGFLTAVILLRNAWKKGKSPYDPEQVMNLMTFQILGVLIGGRIGYALLYQGSKFLEDPLIIFRVWEGGMASHGGFVGVCIATLWYAKQSRQSPFPVGDLIVSIVSPGLFFGRIANFINGELFGKPTNIYWSVIFPEQDNLPRHPSQIYEALLEGLVLFVILNLFIFKKKYRIGLCSILFLTLYGIFRIFSEFFREPDVQIGYIFNYLSMGTFLSIIMIFVGIILFIKSDKNEFNK